MKITLRSLHESDLPYFAQWWRDGELISLTSGNQENLSDGEVREYFDAMFDSGAYHFMIEADGKTVGHVAIDFDEKGEHSINIVIGNKGYWSQGIGTESVRQVICKAKELGITKLYLEVRPENGRAIRAYEKAGFKEVARIERPENKNQPLVVRMEVSNK